MVSAVPFLAHEAFGDGLIRSVVLPILSSWLFIGACPGATKPFDHARQVIRRVGHNRVD